MLLTSLPCIIIILCRNPVLAGNESYAGQDSLIKLAEKISVMFGYVERPLTLEYDESLYRNEMREAMVTIISQMEILDQPLDHLNYLDDNITNEEKCTQTKDLMELKKSLFPLVKKIDVEYKKMKKLADHSPGAGAVIIDSSENPEILQWSKQVRDLLIVDRNTSSANKNAFLLSVEIKSECLRKIRCSKDKHPPLQYVIFRIYLAVVSSVLKTFAVNVLGCQNRYTVDASIKKEDSNKEIAELLSEVKRDIVLIHENMEAYWTSSPKISSSDCDAKHLERNKNFIELERVFQLIIVPEHNSTFRNSSSGGCETLYGQTLGQPITDGDYTAECQGLIRDCDPKKLSNIRYCDISSKKDGIQRYRWIQPIKGWNSDSSPILDKEDRFGEGKCQRKNRKETLKKSGYCLCTCEENTHYSEKSTFIISSELASADVMNNMVVTGVRFVKEDRIIYLTIKEGELLPGGSINHTSDRWKPIQPLNRSKLNAEMERHAADRNYTAFENFIVVSDHVKYVDLNQHRCPSDVDVVTGVGLEIIKSESNSNRIALKIDCHQVDFKKGEILNMNGTLVRANQPHTNKLNIGGLPPNGIDENHIRDSSDNDFVEIRMSDLQKDVGQSVVPWFDSQNVSCNMSLPYAGVELYHKGSINSGGFLALGLIPIDYSRWT